MADHHAGREAVPVVPRPPVLVHERGEEQRCVGDPSGDHDVGAGVEGLDDRTGAEVGVREQGVCRETELIGARTHVVADDGRHGEPRRPRFLQGRDHCPTRGNRVDASRVGDESVRPSTT